MLKFSVLMTVWAKDNPEYLLKSIQSLLNQTVLPDEIILVEDGPLTPELQQILETTDAQSPILKRYPLAQNVGLGAALNYGLEKCHNELVARMDADDIAYSDRFEQQINVFENRSNLDILGGYAHEFVEDENQIIAIKTVPLQHEAIYRFGKRRNPFIHPTVMFKKSTIDSLGGYYPLRRGQDIDLFARLLHAGFRGENLAQPLIKFRAGEDLYKRRKSWKASRNYIATIYRFWRMGYSRLDDLVVATFSRIIMMMIPTQTLKWLYQTFLRKSRNKPQ